MEGMWTLYKQFEENADDQPVQAEYYQVRIITAHDQSGRSYVVEENHGWWSEDERLAKLHTTILSTEDSFIRYQDAMAMVRDQMRHLVSIGFVHLMTRDFLADDNNYLVHTVLSEEDFK
jgi:hypothetical protein